MDGFRDAVEMTQDIDYDGVPFVEASRPLIEHYNKGKMAGFDKVGYFMYEDVRVYETGKRTKPKDAEIVP